MDLSTLNLEQEQMTALEGHILEEVTKAKESFKDFISKDEVEKLTQGEGHKVKTEYSKKVKALEDELVKYKPIQKSESELQLEARLEALEDKEREVQAKEKILNITNELNKQGLPTELAKYLAGAEDVESEIASLKEIFKSNTLENSYKPQTHKSNKGVITKEQFTKMSYMERMNLFKTNEELYNKLSK